MENKVKSPEINEDLNRSSKNNIFLQNNQFLEKNPSFKSMSTQEKSTNPLENDEENKHLKSILSAFFNYQVRRIDLIRLIH